MSTVVQLYPDSSNDSKQSLKPSKSKAKKKSNLYGEGSIYQRKDGRWVVQMVLGTKENGKPNIKYYYCKTEADAKRKLKEVRKELAQKELLSDSTTEKISLEQFITSWYELKQRTLKNASSDREYRTIKNQIIPCLGHIEDMKQLTTKDVQTLLIDKLYKDGYSYSTIVKAYNAINACCKYAMSCMPPIITVNPVTNVIMPKKDSFDTVEAIWFEKDNRDKITQTALATYKNGKHIYSNGEAYLFIMETGLRMGELLALTWRDIEDSENGKVIKVNKNYVYVPDKKTGKMKMLLQHSTKTKSGYRYIPLTKLAIKYLNDIKDRIYLGIDAPIFISENGNPIQPKNFERGFASICKRANVIDEDGTPASGVHRLRHTFASRLFEKGIDIKTISTLLGHSSVQITYDIYIHLAEKQKVKAIIQLDEI